MTVEVQLKKGDFGDSVSEVVVVEWLKQVGEQITADEDIVELESDKATTKWPAPKTGVVTKLMFNAGDTIELPAVIALIDETAVAAAPAAAPAKAEAPAAASAAKPAATGDIRVMPSAAAALAENGLKPSQVTPTGPGGRLLKEDVQRQVAAAPKAPAPAVAKPAPAPAPARTIVAGDRSEKRQAMSPIRKRIASRLVEAQTNAALLTTFNEVDMTAIMDLRKQHQDAFVQRYGIKLGFMSFFVKAAIDALQTFPAINAEIQGNEIVYHNYFDIGIAIGGGKGLVVPVLRNAEGMGFAQIEQAIAEFANKVKGNTLSPQELTGGTFTITNGGVYGSLLSTPIVNPPQSGVLGMHAIQDRPIALNGQVVIRPMMYLALTYDHRIVDGREAVTFLKRIKDCLENPVRLLLDV
ncbi:MULTISPECIES: 2-oxoglutarate dehydrogenase complex dihydrolipoyllysine-residue succinyltransferase [unclassified Schlesneria]|uniref:2-oxoglutarate dehydrogenase complex dihydrolipoyllysine-residue succinyltransferase n=1 Tax=Schlesneria TaxID=656899 RepID=UPI002F21936D